VSQRIDPAENFLAPTVAEGSPLAARSGIASTKLCVLMAHTYYQQRGGEDIVFEAEAELLESFGHKVIRYVRHNRDVTQQGLLVGATDAIWNREVASEIAELVRSHAVDVAHFHNEFPMISPAAFRAAKSAGAAVVKTLHNQRPLCPKAVCFRDGQPCTLCVNKRLAWSGILHGCYRDSRIATAVTSISALVHRWSRTLERDVDFCIAPTNHVRQLYVDSGYPIGRIVLKPHFIEDDLGHADGDAGYALFAGRLSEEKGVDVLLDAWQKLDGPPDLKIIGDGPLLSQAQAVGGAVECLGHLPKRQVYRRMGDAACVILPSSCAETFGRVCVEAFSRGTPVICADHGGQAEVVTDAAGLRFKPGDSDALARCVTQFFDESEQFEARRIAARSEYELRYTPQRNHEQLLGIYAQALLRNGRDVFHSDTPDVEDHPIPANHNQLGRRASGGPETVRATS